VTCFLKIPELLRAELSKAFSHEAGRRQNGLNQKNMDGSETHSRGHDSVIPAASASHPSVQCKYIFIQFYNHMSSCAVRGVRALLRTNARWVFALTYTLLRSKTIH